VCVCVCVYVCVGVCEYVYIHIANVVLWMKDVRQGWHKLTEEGEDVLDTLVQGNIQLLILRGINHLDPLWGFFLEEGWHHIFHANPIIWSLFKLPIL